MAEFIQKVHSDHNTLQYRQKVRQVLLEIINEIGPTSIFIRYLLNFVTLFLGAIVVNR